MLPFRTRSMLRKCSENRSPKRNTKKCTYTKHAAGCRLPNISASRSITVALCCFTTARKCRLIIQNETVKPTITKLRSVAYFNNRSLLTLFRREDKPAYSDQTLEKLHHRYKQWGYCLSQTTDKDIFPRTWEECLKWQNKPNNLVVECVMRVCVYVCVEYGGSYCYYR